MIQSLRHMKHCGYCGGENSFNKDDGGSFTCNSCGQITWAQNKTAVVLAVPVWGSCNENIVGYIVVRRGTEPGAGKLALVSGFQDYMEHPKITAVREFQEEVLGEWGAEEYMLAPELVNITGVAIGGGGMINIITARHIDGISLHKWEEILANFKPNKEITEIMLVDKPISLAFDIHTNLLISSFSAQ